MTARTMHLLAPLCILWINCACDGSQVPELTAEPRASASPELAAPAPPPTAAVPQAPIVEPALATGGSPATVASAPLPVAPASASASVSTTKSPADPNNPCADRYEERTDASGKVTRVLLPKDRRCSYKGEGGISPRGTVYGY